MLYKYGMRLCGYSRDFPFIQGFLWSEDVLTGKYHFILVFDRPLNDYEQDVFGLEYLGEVKDE